MADESKALEVEKQEIAEMEESERTRDSQCFVPRADIYELDDQIVIVADVPGAGEDSVDVTLEKSVLTINAYVDLFVPEGYALTFSEYAVGDYQRSFRISDEIDRDNIAATVKDGVLRVYLPKATKAMTRKISVKAG